MEPKEDSDEEDERMAQVAAHAVRNLGCQKTHQLPLPFSLPVGAREGWGICCSPVCGLVRIGPASVSGWYRVECNSQRPCVTRTWMKHLMRHKSVLVDLFQDHSFGGLRLHDHWFWNLAIVKHAVFDLRNSNLHCRGSFVHDWPVGLVATNPKPLIRALTWAMFHVYYRHYQPQKQQRQRQHNDSTQTTNTKNELEWKKNVPRKWEKQAWNKQQTNNKVHVAVPLVDDLRYLYIALPVHNDMGSLQDLQNVQLSCGALFIAIESLLVTTFRTPSTTSLRKNSWRATNGGGGPWSFSTI